ncbi:MAG: response regulator [Aquabacterium sp.]
MADKPMKILAVDDAPQNLLALQSLVQDLGLELLTAGSGDAALELLLQHDVALALLDVQMPGIDVYMLAELMRGTERTRHVPIIFLTASGDDPARIFRGYEAGAVDYLVKPLDGMVLRSKIRVFADLHWQRQQLIERVAEQERLLQLNRTMLAALSHDIRTPLTALALNAELLLRRGDDVGRRVKAATAILSSQVAHLVNLAARPSEDLHPVLTDCRVGLLVRQQLELPANQALTQQPVQLQVDGDDRASFDADLLSQAIDHLLLQSAGPAADGPIRIDVDGHGRHTVAVRISFDAVLDAEARHHLLGTSASSQELSSVRSGCGLQWVERIARAHGGSVVGRSKEGQGTLYELMLPRGPIG